MAANYDILRKKANAIDQNFANEMDKYLGTGRTDLTASQQLALKSTMTGKNPFSPAELNRLLPQNIRPSLPQESQTFLKQQTSGYEPNAFYYGFENKKPETDAWKPNVQTMTTSDLEKEYGDIEGKKTGFGTRVLNAVDNLLSPTYNATAASAENTANYYKSRVAEKTGLTIPETHSDFSGTGTAIAEAFGKGEESSTLNRQRSVAGELKKRESEKDYTAATTGDTATKDAYENYKKFTEAAKKIDEYVDPDTNGEYNRLSKSEIGELSQFMADYGITGIRLTGNFRKDTKAIMDAVYSGQSDAEKYLKDKGISAKNALWWDTERAGQIAAAEREKAAQEKVNKSAGSAFLANVVSVGAQAMSGIEFVGKVISSLGHNDISDLESYQPLSTYDMICTSYANAVREQTAKNIEDATKDTKWQWQSMNMASFLYQTGMSMADNLAMTLTLGLAAGEVPVLGLMGADAASGAMVNALGRGASNWQAIFTGVAQGAAEIITEKIPLDTLPIFGGSKTNIENTRQLLNALWKTGLAEGTEEIESSLMNAVTDALIMGDSAELAIRVQGYMGQGMSREEAQKQVLGEFLGETMWDGVGGFISGLGMGVLPDLVNLGKNRNHFSRIANTYMENDAEVRLEIEKGHKAAKNSMQYKLATQVQNQLNNSKKGNKVKSSLYGHLVAENYRQVRDAVRDLELIYEVMDDTRDKSYLHNVAGTGMLDVGGTVQDFLSSGWLGAQLGTNAQADVMEMHDKLIKQYGDAIAEAKPSDSAAPSRPTPTPVCPRELPKPERLLSTS